MPTVANMQIPPPKGWDEFQNIALSALRVRWRTRDLHHNGRQGQPQAGVDICGRDDRGRHVGVQCKLISGEAIELKAIIEEIAKAESFVPPLEAYFIATTAKRDAKIQHALRILSEERRAKGRFEVVALFWEDLASDLAGDLEEFGKHYPELMPRSVTPIGPPIDEVEAIFGPDFLPTLTVQGDEWFRIRVYSPAFMRRTFEPEEEDQFLALVKEGFWEDAAAILEPAQSARVGVENRGADGAFHRRWVWWTGTDSTRGVGAIGMAGTLRDLQRPNAYSVAEMAIDMARLLFLVARLGLDGDHRTVFQINPFRLVPAWDLSDLRARGKPEGTLGGVVSGGIASTAHRTEKGYSWNGRLGDLAADPLPLVGGAVVHGTKDLHGARISSEKLAASLPRLLDFARRVRYR